MTVTILHGPNAVDSDERGRELLSAADPAGISTSQIELVSVNLEDVRAILATPAFFGTGRALHARGVPGVDKGIEFDWESLEHELDRSAAGTTVVLSTGSRIPSNRRLLKSAKSRGWEIELFEIPYGRALETWLDSRFRGAGVEAEQQARREILDRLFPVVWKREDRWNPQTIDMRLLATEVDKLAAAAAPGAVTTAHVLALTPDRSGVTAFKLGDDTYEGRTANALSELDSVLASGEAPERVLGQMSHTPLVFMAAQQVDRFGPEVVSDVSGVSTGQINATIARKSGWRKSGAIVEACEELRQAEWQVKSGRARGSEAVIVPTVGAIAEAFRKP